MPDPAPTEVVVSATQLSDAVRMVRPFLGTDDTMPMLTHYQLKVRRGALWLAATDRYAVGAARIAPDTVWDDVKQRFPTGFDVLLPRQLLQRTLTIFPPKNKRNPVDPVLSIRVTPKQVVIEQKVIERGVEPMRLTTPRPDYKCPDIVKLLLTSAQRWQKGQEIVERTGLNGRFLTKFADVPVVCGDGFAGTPVVFRQAAFNTPIVVTCGKRFAGALMPIKIDHEPDDFAQWLDWLGDAPVPSQESVEAVEASA